MYIFRESELKHLISMTKTSCQENLNSQIFQHFRCIANDYLRLLLPYVNGGTSNKSRSSSIATIYGACGKSDICAGQIMASGNELISQSYGNVLQKTTPS